MAIFGRRLCNLGEMLLENGDKLVRRDQQLRRRNMERESTQLGDETKESSVQLEGMCCLVIRRVWQDEDKMIDALVL